MLEEMYTVLNVYNIQQCMFLFTTYQTQIAYSFQRNEKESKSFGSESHKTAGISKSICMNIHEWKGVGSAPLTAYSMYSVINFINLKQHFQILTNVPVNNDHYGNSYQQAQDDGTNNSTKQTSIQPTVIITALYRYIRKQFYHLV